MSKRTRQKLAAAVNQTLSLNADWRPLLMERLEPRQLLSTANGLQSLQSYTAGNLPYAVVSGDFAKNGKLDLAVVNSGSNNISILMGNGDGTFNAATNYSTGGNTPLSIAEADLNGDGYLDLVITNYTSNSVAVFMNKGDGTGTFNNAVTYTVGSHPGAIGIADLNGDTKPDLIIANRLGNSLSVLLNTGTGTFGAQTTYSVGSGTTPYAIATGNFGNGHQDVAVAEQGTSKIGVFLGNGSGTLGTVTTYSTGSGPVAVAAADLTGNGTLSLITANASTNSISVLLGNNNGTFQTKTSYAVGTSPHAIAVADMNGDNTPDLIVANSGSNNISVLDGTGIGTFGSAVNSPAGTSPFGLTTGDFNGDSRTDVAVADFSSASGNVSVLLGKEIAAQGVDVTADEGSGFSGNVATFTDTESGIAAGSYTANINWGDGTTSVGSVTATGGSFTVSGSHTYDEYGSSTVTVTIADPGGATTTASALASINDAAITATGATLSATEGTGFVGSVVASFTDAYSGAVAGQFTTFVDWGDGTTSSGTVVSTGGGTFNVEADHTYNHAGAQSVFVTISDDGGSSDTGISTVNVANATITPTGTSFTKTEGQSFSNLQVATFTDANTASIDTDFTASIDWGDGVTTAGAVSGNNGTFAVSGSSSYVHAGSDTVTVTILGLGGGSVTTTTAATVDNASLAATGVTITPTEGSAFTTTTVATFTDANALASSGDFTASIVWGDGNTSTGAVSGSNGTYTVTGGNTYVHAGSDTITVTVTGFSASPTATSTASVGNAALAGTGTTITETEGSSFSGTTVATFTDANSGAASGDFTASIVWGDGTTTSGAVSGSNGTYVVKGGNTYAHAGSAGITVTLHGAGGGTATAHTTATVDNAALAGTGTTLSETEGSAFSSVTVATFTDVNTTASSGDFSASIVWGNGNTSAGAVSGSNGTYTVKGGNTYAHAGSDVVTVTITGFSGITSGTTTATVDNAALAGTGTTITPTEGSAFTTTTVATFTDANASASSGDFSASIVWGDGNTSAGAVSGSNGTYTVTGGNTYSDAGSDLITVTISGFSGSTSATSTASVGNADLAATGVSLSGTEGVAFGLNTWATFTDANTSATFGDFSASINWGDGTTTVGNVDGSNGTYGVTSDYTYAHAGTHDITVTIIGAGGTTITAGSTATVDNDVLASTGTTISETEGSAFSSVTVATFTDVNTAASSGDFSASIDWGDGNTTVGAVSGSDGTYTIAGGNTYAHAGTDVVTVTITGFSSNTVATTTATVDNAALTGTGAIVGGTEGTTTGSVVVATFTDVNAAASSSDFTASIVWGDGNTSAGAVSGSNGTYTVKGGNTYVHAGSDTISVTINGFSGNTSATSTAHVGNAHLAATGTTMTETEGSSFAATTVATFTDANTGAVSGDFTASINWGDGTTTAGAVSGSNGTYVVKGGNAYAHAGTDLITVTIIGAGGGSSGSVQATSTATVDNAALAGTGTTISETEGSAFSSTTVATFTDVNTAASSSDFTASIVWGDGNTTTGTVTGSDGTYTVTGGNTYSHAGSDLVTVSISGFSGSTSGTTTATVDNAALAGTGASITGTEGATTETVTVATFTDANASASSGDFSASIDWGDGNTSSGAVGGSDGTYTVSGSNLYQEAGTYSPTVTVSGFSGSVAPVGTATIADAAITATGVNTSPVEGVSFSNQLVATFTDANSYSTTSDFTVSIDWGDGTSSNGTLLFNAGVYSVTASHEFDHPGTKLSTVTVNDISSAGDTAISTASIADAALNATGTTITETEGAAFTGANVGTFTDANTAGSSDDFSATIAWGDGNISTGTVAGSNGTYTVSGGDTYLHTGTDVATITIAAAGGDTLTTTTTATVDNAVLAGTGTSITPTEGSAFSGISVASFSDVNTAATTGDFTASIDWGDGTTSVGTLSGGDGSFGVEGGHTYAHAGTDSITVTLNGFSSSASAVTTATVGNGVLTGTGTTISETEGGAFTTTTVATFTDSNSSAASGDFTASIDWGDGNTTSGAVSGSNGTYTVEGGNTYAHAGSDNITVTITGAGGRQTTANSTASVANAALASTGITTTKTEGVQIANLSIATFTDANTSADPGDFNATINWGDGTIGAANNIIGSDGSYTVRGGHKYLDAGVEVATITIVGNGSSTTSVTSTITVDNAALAGTGTTISETEGSAFTTATVATFTDVNHFASSGDFTASIVWGDGNTSAGAVSGSNGTYTVKGGNTYAHAGSDIITVSITGFSGSTSATSTATVGNAALAGTGTTISETEGSAFTTTTVATFTDANASAASGDFTASIVWGDGNTSAGAVSGSNGTYTVTGGNTYAHAGSDTITVTLHGAGGGTATASSTATVGNAALAGTGATITPTEGAAFTGVTVATFTDANAAASSGDFTASIVWGDGNTSTGTVSGSGGTYTVIGGNTYAHAGSDNITISIVGLGGDTLTTASTATVGNAALTATGATITPTEGSPFSSTAIATFTDANVLAGSADFSATIQWGDGNTSTGSVTGSGGTFTVLGGNDYAEEGSDAVTVSIVGLGGTTATANSDAEVADAPLSATAGSPISTTEGISSGNVVFAHFTDGNPGATTSDFSATIQWGDGGSGAGTIVASGGGFNVVGSHLYTAGNQYTASISISDTGGQDASTTASVTTTNQLLSGTGKTLSATEGTALTGSTLLGTFTDAYAGNTDPGAFTGQVNWDDGSEVGNVTVAYSGGTFGLIGGHTYEHAGTYTISLEADGLGGGSTDFTTIVNVDNAAMAGTGTTITPTEGAAFSSVTVATFTDANASSASGDFTATIDWGDGNTTSGAVSGSNGTFSVLGGHTYAHAGSDTLTIDIAGLGTGTTSATSTATVGNASLAATGQPISAVEGTAFTGTTVATFTDSNASASSGDFTASIVWGDGNSSTGTVSGSSGTYSVAGGNTYAHAGTDVATITIVGAGGTTITAHSTATVDNGTITPTAATTTQTEGSAFTGVTVATFTDSNHSAASGDFSATIVWGDGHSSTGMVTGSNGNYTVKGGNTYAHTGTDLITVTINGAGGSSTSTIGTATVDNAALTGTAATITATEGAAFTGDAVATFTDANASSASGDFTASINWGDSTTSVGAVTGSNGTFSVAGDHDYKHNGTDHITVTVSGFSASTTVTSTATVADAALAATGTSFTGTEGAPLTNVVVATLTDANPFGTTSDYSVLINWGDTHTSTGSVVSDGEGGFNVVGTHTYSTSGFRGVGISVIDVGSSLAVAVGSASISVGSLSTTAAGPISETEGVSFSDTTLTTFSDTNLLHLAGNYSATINWGDGTSSSGTVNSISTGSFSVTGVHTYSHAGSDNITVTLGGTDSGTASANTSASVANAAMAGTGTSITETEGLSFVGTTVATFTDVNTAAASGDFTATIVWGDGNSSTGTISGSNGAYSVLGSHLYAHTGTDVLTISIAGLGNGTASASSTATVDSGALSSTGTGITEVEGSSFSSVTVATFTDANTAASSGDFTASIVWGNGDTTAGAVSGSNGTYTVKGGDVYARTGTDVITVTIAGFSSTTIASSTATVDNAALASTGTTITPTEGTTTGNVTVATFTDANTSASSSDFTASIVWGDGNSSTGTVTGSNGTYSVAGANTYAHAGSDTITVTIHGFSSNTIATSTASVQNAAMAGTGTTITEVEGTAFSSVTVATFTDANHSASSSDFTASIVWGDGNTTTGTVSGSNGTYTVLGGNTYAHTGTDVVTVSIAGLGNGTASATTTATVDSGVLASTGTTITPTEGTAFTTITVATFTDANTSAASGDFSASIVWGDGNSSTGTVSGSNGTYTVKGGNTYAHAGSDSITVTITGFSSTTIATSTATVANAAMAGTGTTITPTEGTAFTGVTVATFTDANHAASSGDFTASITWGDGNSSTGTITGSNGTYTVTGGNTYAHAGTDLVTVSIAGLGSGTTSAVTTATVNNAALAGTGTTITEVEGTAFSTTTVATFTDVNSSAASSDFTASINWGDGNTSAGAVSGSNGAYTVSGGDTYAHAGTDHITVTIDGFSGTTSATSTATVNNAALAATGTTITPTEGSTFSSLSVGTFTDANASASSSDFTALISWGDGNFSTGTVTGSGGTYTVLGGNDYAHAGTAHIQVTVAGLGGGTTTIHSTATIGNAELAGTGTTLSTVEGQDLGSPVVATFTDANASASSSDFTASIVWGDGNTSTGTVSGSNGTYSVTGNDTYLHAGSDVATVTILGAGNGTATAHTTVTVDNAAMASTGTTLSGTEGTALSSVTVATFTDVNTAAASGDFSATINWGDNSSSTGTITGSNGTYSVAGDHTYADAGVDTISITVDGNGTGTTSTTSIATLGNAALASTGTGITEVEGSSFSSVTVATFTDANMAASSGDFTASIVWGNGDTTAGAVSGSNGTYTVKGGDVYARTGTDVITVTIAGFSSTTIASSTATVDNAALASTGTTITPTEGTTTGNVTVATFTDANTSASSSDFTASIVWGDGNSSTGTVTGSNGTYSVAGANTYAHAGSDTITVTLHGFSSNTLATSTASVQNAALAGTGTTITEVEGTAFSGTTVATFTDANASASSSDFTASIVWGDGNTTTGTVSGSNGTYSVSGGDTYAHAGSDVVTVTLTGFSTNSIATTTANVQNAALAGTGTSLPAVEGTAFSNTAVAVFTDANHSASSSDFTALITWGDGNTSTGTISGSNGTYTVKGGNTYAHAGNDLITVSIAGLGAGTTGATSSVTVHNAPMAGTGTTITPTEGAAFSSVTVATFTDANHAASSGDFTASIVWGDGNSSTGTITGSNGTYTVAGGNTYAHAGTDTISVSITGLANGTASATSTATVANATLIGTGASISTTEGQNFAGQVLGTFTDANNSAISNDFTALIHWGNGHQSTATIVADNGGFDITGTRPYSAAGVYTITVNVTGLGGGTSTITSTATVADATLTAGTGSSLTVSEGQTLSGVAATFTDAFAGSSTSDFTALIHWGDGNTSTGTVSETNNTFSVSGSHAYQHTGSDTVTVSVTDIGGATTNINDAVTVTAATLTAGSAIPLTSSEGVAFSGSVGTFTSSSPLAATGDFTATINWNDGNSSAGTIALSGSTFTVSGGHTYTEEGSKTVGVTIVETNGHTISLSDSMTIGDAALTGTAANISAVEQTAMGSTTTLGTFHDANTAAPTSDFTAHVVWGDGSSGLGTVVSLGGGNFAVRGGHTYAGIGTDAMTVTINDIGGASATIHSTVTVADLPITAAGVSAVATEGTSFSGKVGSIVDGSLSAASTDYTATITWSDGTTSIGTIVKTSNGHFDVDGTHTYAYAGTYALGLSVVDHQGPTATATTRMTVNDAAITATAAPELTVTRGSAFTGVLATFTDANPQTALTHQSSPTFTASINWGDGNTSAGTVTLVNGKYSISGTHTYAGAATYAATVSIGDAGGATARAITAIWAKKPLSAKKPVTGHGHGTPPPVNYNYDNHHHHNEARRRRLDELT